MLLTYWILLANLSFKIFVIYSWILLWRLSAFKMICGFFFFFGVTVSCLLSRCSTMWTKLPTLSVIVVFQIVSCVFAPSSLDMILLYAFCIGWWQIPVTKLSLLVKMGWPQTEPPDLCLPSSKDYSMSPTLWKLFFFACKLQKICVIW
jgi:hypothetical protein